MWLHGPPFLHKQSQPEPDVTLSNLTGTQPDDPEVRPQLKTLTRKVGKATNLETHGFTRFSEWPRLVRAVMRLITVVRNFQKNRANKGTALRSESVHLSIHQQQPRHPETS